MLCLISNPLLIFLIVNGHFAVFVGLAGDRATEIFLASVVVDYVGDTLGGACDLRAYFGFLPVLYLGVLRDEA